MSSVSWPLNMTSVLTLGCLGSFPVEESRPPVVQVRAGLNPNSVHSRPYIQAWQDFCKLPWLESINSVTLEQTNQLVCEREGRGWQRFFTEVQTMVKRQRIWLLLGESVPFPCSSQDARTLNHFLGLDVSMERIWPAAYCQPRRPRGTNAAVNSHRWLLGPLTSLNQEPCSVSSALTDSGGRSPRL